MAMANFLSASAFKVFWYDSKVSLTPSKISTTPSVIFVIGLVKVATDSNASPSFFKKLAISRNTLEATTPVKNLNTSLQSTLAKKSLTALTMFPSLVLIVL